MYSIVEESIAFLIDAYYAFIDFNDLFKKFIKSTLSILITET